MPAPPGFAISILEHTRPTVAGQIAHVLREAVPDAPWQPEPALIMLDQARYLGASRGDVLHGLLALSALNETTQVVSSLAVDRDWRRRGIGLTLLETAIELAGHQVLMLAVEVSNSSALALYQQTGFVEHGRFVEGEHGRAMIRLWRPAA
jgi:ribosomal protein S18 acetylase RimI-like enzyme